MTPRTVIVHGLEHALAALRAAREHGTPVVLVSSPSWAAAVGAGSFRALCEAARERVPGVEARFLLDCRDEPGRALNAFRHGVEAVCCAVPEPTRQRLLEIAGRCGSALVPSPILALDLAEAPDPESACRRWLEP